MHGAWASVCVCLCVCVCVCVSVLRGEGQVCATEAEAQCHVCSSRRAGIAQPVPVPVSLPAIMHVIPHPFPSRPPVPPLRPHFLHNHECNPPSHPLGILACFSRLTDATLFLVMYGLTAVYFSGVMVSCGGAGGIVCVCVWGGGR